MFLLHCLRRPCCDPVTSSEILVADCSKKLKDFGSSLRTSFFALVFREVQNRLTAAASCCCRLRSLIRLVASGVDLLVGRLGFEPRQSAPKALDLPLVDRPVHRRI